jgi:predicted nucleic-acid-binding protein
MTKGPSQAQSDLARKLIESGKPLFVSKSVMLELEWVLRGYYKSPVADVLVVLRHLQTLPNLEMEDSIGVDWAIDALEDGFDFADALHHASYRQCHQVVTFDDRKFSRRALSRGWKPPVKVLV